ncbi:hypothetical protein [Pseudomonas sp.]|uniref:hypothetical protein n=1 Tax=Pseudomonas sp. TaxID=306 RepID=UPI00273143BE|nr:hypothetical protein [Pseudomonas sp.]MDP2446597.1 hypothetical protein [Pseudomonas sp.]MDZ4334283.1 hypothetical protein [Pseudomonas sp.]
MPVIKLTDLFKFSPDGIKVIEYPPGEHDLDGRALEVAVSLDIVEGDVPPPTDPLKMNVKDLKAWLTAKGIAFDESATKPTLLALVPK